MRGLMQGKTVPILVVLLAIVLFWYVMAVVMNAPWQQTLNGRAHLTDVPITEFAQQTWAQDKPILPAPHQVIGEIWNATADGPIAVGAPVRVTAVDGLRLRVTALGSDRGQTRVVPVV